MGVENEEMDLRQKKYLEQQTDCSRYKRKISKSRRGPSWKNQSCLIIITFRYQTTGNHATELSTVGDITSEQHWSSTFDFT